MAIQKREDDLVLASFGRGFFVLDDYSPLRNLKADVLNEAAFIFPIKDALMFIQSAPYGHRGKGFQGESFYTAPNPPVAAVFTYYLKDEIKTLKQKRQDLEKEKIKKGEAIDYPSLDAMHAEDNEEAPYLLFTVADENGNVVRRIKAAATKGLNRIDWDFRYPSLSPASNPEPDLSNPYSEPDEGPLAMPGKYTVSLAKFESGKLTELVKPQPFNAVALNSATLVAQDKKAVLDFNKKVAELSRAADGAGLFGNEMTNRVRVVKKAILNSNQTSLSALEEVSGIELSLKEINVRQYGDPSLSKREFSVQPSLSARIDGVVSNAWRVTCAPTVTVMDSYKVAAADFKTLLADMKALNTRLEKMETQLELNKAPYTPGRLPEWKDQ